MLSKIALVVTIPSWNVPSQDVVKVISKTHGKELKFGGVMPLLGY